MVKKPAAFALCAAALSVALSFALAHPDADRPNGVAAEAWIPLSADAGFVVTEGAAHGATTPSVNGYLMARRDGKWIRLEPETGGRLTPAK
jgi:hypothetical protein